MSGDSEFVEVTCRGLLVAARARLAGDFVEVEAPLPVGTRITITRPGRDPEEARVTGVVEMEANAKSPPGMRLAFGRHEAASSAAPEHVDDAASSAVDAGGGDASGGKKGRRGKKKNGR